MVSKTPWESCLPRKLIIDSASKVSLGGWSHRYTGLAFNYALHCPKFQQLKQIQLAIKLYCYASRSRQSCPTLCDHIDGSPPGSPVLGILQATILEWVAIFFSSAWKWKVKVKPLSRVRLLATPWTVAYQAPPSMGFPRQEYWSGLPLPSPHKGLYVYERSIKLVASSLSFYINLSYLVWGIHSGTVQMYLLLLLSRFSRVRLCVTP